MKKMDGSDFPGKTLYDIIICVQFHLETLSYSWKLLNEEKFKEIRFTLDNTMKKHTSDGIGVSVWKAQTLSSFWWRLTLEHVIQITQNSLKLRITMPIIPPFPIHLCNPSHCFHCLIRKFFVTETFKFLLTQGLIVTSRTNNKIQKTQIHKIKLYHFNNIQNNLK